MVQIKNKNTQKIGYSDIRMHGLIMAAMVLILIIAPFLGFLASVLTVIVFGIFTAIKISEFQRHNPESNLRFQAEMDRIYHNSCGANYYKAMLSQYEKKVIKKPIKQSKKILTASPIFALN